MIKKTIQMVSVIGGVLGLLLLINWVLSGDASEKSKYQYNKVTQETKNVAKPKYTGR